MSAVGKAKRMLLGIEIPRDELAVRIAAKCIGIKPTGPVDATASLDIMNAELGATGNGMGEDFRRAADAAVIYFHECINAGRQPS